MTHGKKILLNLEEENFPILEKYGVTLMQSIVVVALCFGMIIDNAMLLLINEIGSK